MNTLVERLEHAATSSDRGVTFVCEDPVIRLTWRELHEDAKVMSRALRRRGVAVGGHVALLGPTSRNLVTAIRATWLTGATVVVLPLPMRMSSIDAFVEQTRTRILHADIDLLIVDEQLAPFVDHRPGDPPQCGFEDLVIDTPSEWERPPADGDRLAILQYTSGSTSDPKGVMLPEKTLLANLDALTTAGKLDQEGPDVFVSWLPLYHDMGLVGILTTAMAFGNELVLAAPQDFMASPSRWVQWLSDYHGTLTAAPNFAYALAARAMRRMDNLDLAPLRLAINGAEPVDAKAVERFTEAGKRHGMRETCVFPAFGMAEVGIAGTFPEPLTGLRVDTVDQRVLETERLAVAATDDRNDAKTFARLGKPVPGLSLRIVDPETLHPMGEREVGELQLKGTSVTSGYYQREDATNERFVDGWLRTGDLAYVAEGDLVVCGRIKDMIIVAGRNVFPEDVEHAVAQIEGIRTGNVIAFGCEDDRRVGLIVVAETKLEAPESLLPLVAQAVRDAIGLPAKDVVLVPAGTLPKTSSGKLQRSLCRSRYLEKAYATTE